MKFYRIIFSLLSSSSFLLADAEPSPVLGSTLYVGPAWDFVNSRWGNGTKQTGSLWGLNAGYTYATKDTIYFQGQFTFMGGMLKGSAGNDPTQEYITEARLGYDISSPFGEKFTMTPFLGMGIYIFNQSIAGSDSFHSHFWYAPIGVMIAYQVTPAWSIGFTGLGAPTFSGRWKIDHTKDAPTSALWQGELPVTYTGASPFRFSLMPFIKGWAYHNSGDLIEQRNTYYGLKALFGYCF
ncbi:MAG: hypothetical protein FJZ58_05420 [Chlamydiae bacterium]|nr:hypothetical protein [Chlamydiota bacterium]